MNKFNFKLGSAVAIAAFVASVIAPAGLADTTTKVTNNGADSNNTVDINNKSKTTLNQTNNSTVLTEVNASSNTGYNKASGNTGGDTSITTGNAKTSVHVIVGGPVNAAIAPDCNCPVSDKSKISGNGEGSNNSVSVDNKKKLKALQVNNTEVGTGVNAKANTGKSKAKNNTGGSTGIETGNSKTKVHVEVTGPVNTHN